MLLLTSLLASVYALAPLEPTEKGILFGPWYERLVGDTPQKILERTKLKNPFSLYQSDMNLTSTCQGEFIDNFAEQVTATGTNAILYLTLYPIMGFQEVTDAGIEQFSQKILQITNTGRKVLIRYASEMNGGWFRYGQQPTAAIASWKRVVDSVRRAVPDRSKYAFLWAPNAANGYPFAGGEYSNTKETASAADFAALDSNGDGVYDARDDPYTPFYPGDDYVDWVGFSLYHYGREWPWVTNDVPMPGKAEAILTGKPGWGNYNFYEMFCGSGAGGNPASRSQGSKPFMVTETGSTIHMAVGPTTATARTVPANGDAQSRVPIKQGWWRQLVNSTFLEQYPKIKGISTFEFIKYEETSWRDFTNMGPAVDINSPVGNDGGALDGLVLAAFQADFTGPLENLVIWGKKESPSLSTPGTPLPAAASPSGPAQRNSAEVIGGIFDSLLAVIPGIFALIA